MIHIVLAAVQQLVLRTARNNEVYDHMKCTYKDMTSCRADLKALGVQSVGSSVKASSYDNHLSNTLMPST